MVRVTQTGFAFARFGRIASYIGPVAGDAASVCMLLDDLLSGLYLSRPSMPVFIDIPHGSPLASHLPNRGFRIARALMRMTRPAANIRSAPAACAFELG